MLDSELAELYGVETKVLNQAVERNTDRFPVDFSFLLSPQDVANLKSQNCDFKFRSRWCSKTASSLHRNGRCDASFQVKAIIARLTTENRSSNRRIGFITDHTPGETP